MKKNLNHNIIVLLLMTLLIMPTVVSAKHISIKSGEKMYKDYYIYEQGGAEFNDAISGKNYNEYYYISENFTFFRPTKDNFNEAYPICLGIPLKEGSNEYWTYYGIAKKESGTWAKIPEECEDVITIKEYYQKKIEINSSDHSEAKDIDTKGTILNSKYMVATDKLGENQIEKLKKDGEYTDDVCAIYQEQKGTMSTKRYLLHSTNLSVNQKAIIGTSYSTLSSRINKLAEKKDTICSDTSNCSIQGHAYCATSKKVTIEKWNKLKNVTMETSSKVTKTENKKVTVNNYGLELGNKIYRMIAYDNNNFRIVYVREVKNGENSRWYEVDNKGNIIRGKIYVPATLSSLPESVKNKLKSSEGITVANNMAAAEGFNNYRIKDNNWYYRGKCVTSIDPVITIDCSNDVYVCRGDKETCGYMEIHTNDNGDFPYIPYVNYAYKSKTATDWDKYIQAGWTTKTINNVVSNVTLTDLKVVEINNNHNYFSVIRSLDLKGMKNNFQVESFDTGKNIYSSDSLPAVVLHEHTTKCSQTPQKLELSCKSFQGKLNSEEFKTKCQEYFSSETNPDNDALFDFAQKGIIKINLQNTYIKSGESFALSMEYEDTISMKKIDGKVDTSITKQLKDFITNAELFNLSRNIEIKYDKKIMYDKAESKGTVTYYINGKKIQTININEKPSIASVAANTLANELVDKGKEVKIKVVYEMPNAYTNSNKQTSDGVEHVYTLENPNAKKYRFDGKIYYTKLTDKGQKDIEIKIDGLSALNYTSESKPFWSAYYKCNINCNQEFYNDTPKGYKFSYREIDNNNPFPQKDNSKSKNLKESRIGLDGNWLTWADSIGYSEKIETEEALTKYIEPRLANAYNNLQYSVTITPQGTKYIKEYNNNNENNYYSGVRYINNTKSNFLDTITTLSNNKVIAKRDNNIKLIRVGYCGDSRTRFNSITGSFETDLINTGCFCIQTDTTDRCIYNKNIEGVGY